MAVRRRYSTRLLLAVAAIGAAGGLLHVALNYSLVWVPPSTVSYSIYAVTTPIWFVAPFNAVALFRLPGVGLIAALVCGVVNFVTPYGLWQFVNAVVAGVLLELPFAVAGYRRWSDRTLWIALPIASLLMSAAYFASCWFGGVVDPAQFFPWLAIVVLVGSVAVAFGLAWVALAVARRLQRAGLGARTTDTAAA